MYQTMFVNDVGTLRAKLWTPLASSSGLGYQRINFCGRSSHGGDRGISAREEEVLVPMVAAGGN